MGIQLPLERGTTLPLHFSVHAYRGQTVARRSISATAELLLQSHKVSLALASAPTVVRLFDQIVLPLELILPRTPTVLIKLKGRPISIGLQS